MNLQAGNPYIAGAPLRDPSGFFGRRDILDWVLAELLNVHTNALVLYGQRRVGKTTVLLQLKHHLPSDKFFTIYVDLQDQAKKHLGKVLADLADVVGSYINLSDHKPENFDDEGKYFRSVFLPDLYRALDDGCRPVFLLDEFDVLGQEDEEQLESTMATKALFPFLKQVMNDNLRSAFVFVVGRQPEDLRVDFNQMFKTSLTKEVWVLDRESAEALIRQAETNGTLKFTPQAVERILQLTSNHAYLTQLICQRIWQRSYLNKPTETPTIDIDNMLSSIPDTLEVGEHALKWLWDGLSPAEKIYAAALAEISNEGKPIPEDRVIEVLADHAARLRRREVEVAPKDLVTRHVLEPTGNREYLFAVELFRRWVKQKCSLKDVIDEIDRVDPLAEHFFQTGQDFYKKHEWDEAIQYFKKALERNSSHYRANKLLGEAFLSKEQLEEAVLQLKIAYSLDKYETQYPLARALIAYAKAKENDGFDNEALLACEQALEVSPNERLAQDIKKGILERRGEAALKRGDLESALAAFEQTGNTEKIERVRKEYQRASVSRTKQLSALRMKLRSPKPSDVLLGIKESTQWLREDNEDWDVYGVLLDAVKETSELRDQVRNLLIEMMQRGSSAAQRALSIIPLSVSDLLADADDAYYAVEYEQALQLYRQVLKLDPENERAKEQIEKAKLEQSKTGDIKTGLPRDAVQYYRRARSYIAAKDFQTARRALSAAVEVAQERGMNYPDAEELLSIAQDSLIAEEFKQKAKLAMENKQWKDAMDLYDKALRLEKTDKAVKKELDSIQTLLRAESELRKKGILRIFAPLGQIQNATRVARDVVNSDNPLLNFVEKQLNQIKLIRIGSVGILFLVILFAAFLSEKIDPFEIYLTPTNISSITRTLTNSSTLAISETPTQTMVSNAAIDTITVYPVATATQTLKPIITATTVLGYGKLTGNFFPVEEPNGKRIEQLLYYNQLVTIIDSKNDHGAAWYICTWEKNGVAGEGWILGDYIKFVPPPSPTTPATTLLLGYGTLTANVFPVEEPNGKAMEQILYRKQLVTIWEERADYGFVWYKCKWEVNGVTSEGWILAKYIQRISMPSSTP